MLENNEYFRVRLIGIGLLIFLFSRCDNSLDCRIILSDTQLNFIRVVSNEILSKKVSSRRGTRISDFNLDAKYSLNNSILGDTNTLVGVTNYFNEGHYVIHETDWNLADEKHIRYIVYYSEGRQTSFTEEPWYEICRNVISNDIHCVVEKVVN